MGQKRRSSSFEESFWFSLGARTKCSVSFNEKQMIKEKRYKEQKKGTERGRKVKEKQRESTKDSYSRHKVRERHSNKAQTWRSMITYQICIHMHLYIEYTHATSIARLLTWTTNRCDCPDSPRDCWDFVSWAASWSSPQRSRVHCANSSSLLARSSLAVWEALYVDTFHRYPSPLKGDRIDPRVIYSLWHCAVVSQRFSVLSCRM